MPSQRLTDITSSTGITSNDLIHIVITADTSQNPAGSSYKARISQVQAGLSGRFGIANSNGVYTFYPKIQTAITAASAGQTVEVFTDYEETNAISIILKDNVDINFNGHTYTLNNSGTDNAFIDNSVVVECKLYNGTIIRKGSTSEAINTNNCLYLSEASTIITDCTLIGDKNVLTTNNRSATDVTIIGGNHISISGSTNGFIRLSSDSVFRNAYVECINSAATVGTIITSSNSRITNCIINSVGSGIPNTISATSDSQIIKCIVNSESTGIIILSNSNVINSYVTSNSTSSNGIIVRNNSQVINSTSIIQSTNASTAAIKIDTTTGSTIIGSTAYAPNTNGIRNDISGSYIYNSNSYGGDHGILFANSGTVENTSVISLTLNGINSAGSAGGKIKNCNVEAISNSSILSSAGLSQYVIQVNNSVVKSSWNNSGGHSIRFASNTSGHTISSCHLITSNSAANAILGNGTSGVNYVNNNYQGMTAATASIVQLTTNVQDTRNNILIN